MNKYEEPKFDITLLDAIDIIRTSNEENELDKAEKNAGSTVYLWEK